MLDPKTVSIPEKFKNHPLFTQPILGMNFGFMAKRGYYSTEEALKQPELIAKAGVNWVTINMNFCQEAFYSRKLFLDFAYSTGELELYEMVRRLHENGVHVLFKPCMTPLDSAWMGSVAFPEGRQIQSVEMSYWEQWFASFKEASAYFAKLAQTVGMDALLIGAEYYGTEGRSKEWREVIDIVRKHYDGPISYEFMYTSRKAYPLDWFDQLDFLSYSYYPPAAPDTFMEDWSKSPTYTLKDMENFLAPRKEKIAEISKDYFNKPIVFTEIGCRSTHGCCMSPANYATPSTYDGEEQANYMEAALNTFYDLPCWMGFFWWKWDETQYRPHYHTDPRGDCGFTIQGKPAEKVFARWMKEHIR